MTKHLDSLICAYSISDSQQKLHWKLGTCKDSHFYFHRNLNDLIKMTFYTWRSAPTMFRSDNFTATPRLFKCFQDASKHVRTKKMLFAHKKTAVFQMILPLKRQLSQKKQLKWDLITQTETTFCSAFDFPSKLQATLSAWEGSCIVLHGVFEAKPSGRHAQLALFFEPRVGQWTHGTMVPFWGHGIVGTKP